MRIREVSRYVAIVNIGALSRAAWDGEPRGVAVCAFAVLIWAWLATWAKR